MEITPHQFNALIGELKKIREHLEQLRDTIRQEQEANRQNQQNQTPPSVIVHSELQIPEAQERDHGRRDDRAHRQQVWLTVGTWLAFIAASVYAGIAAFQLGQMRAANSLAKEANCQTRQLAASQAAEYEWEQSASLLATESIGYPPAGGTLVSMYSNIGFRRAGRLKAVYTLTKRMVGTDAVIGKPQQIEFTCSHEIISLHEQFGDLTGRGCNQNAPLFPLSPREEQLLRNADAFFELTGSVSYFDGFKNKTDAVCYRMVNFQPIIPRQESTLGGNMNLCADFPVDLENARRARALAKQQKQNN